ncbi:MAG TPA: PTS system mannose/fructose/sorbose family transporter subunit IID [Thermodesulfobacteriota bacterium]|nr:PTS system mannose/fructose/sorbose family transporter subunit IID [Thermodesulfobacteriota bacterium]
MIGRFTIFKVFLNSFFIQSAWSFEKMQGLGFASAIAPAIKDIYKDRDQASAALKRHMVFYNAHPYMASPILGAVIRMEEEVEDGKLDAKEVVSFKESLIGPYGAIGDTFFWGSVRPTASVLGVLSALILSGGLWGPIVFLVVYNIFHIWMRWVGLNKGYKLGGDVVEYIKTLGLPGQALRIRIIATGLLGIMVAALIFKLFKTGMFGIQPVQIYQLFLITGFITTATILLSILLRKGISVSLAIYLLFLPAIIFLVVMNMLQRVG